jgi:RNA polymerase sigma factor for flagellar operon FliA
MIRQALCTKEHELGLWQRWHDDADRNAREELVRMYLPLVEFLSARLGRFVPASYRPDLFSFGVLGLLDAIDKFHPEYGHSFKTYGSRRIQGAIGDGIRRLNWLPRGARTRASRVIESVVPIDFQTATTPIGVRIQDCLADPHEHPVGDDIELAAEHQEVSAAIQVLPDRERKVVTDYYFARKSLAEIGTDLGVTESRACQIHRSAIGMLRSVLVAARQIA